MLLQANISKQIFLKRGFGISNNASKSIYYFYSRNFELLCIKPIPAIRNFLTRNVSTAISKNTQSKNDSISSYSSDIIKFINFLKDENVNEAKSFLSTQSYCTTIDNTLEFKDSLIQHLNSFDAEFLNKANIILHDQFIQAALKHNLHKTDPQVLNLYNELYEISYKRNLLFPEQYLTLFCVYFLSIIKSRNFELSPPKYVVLESDLTLSNESIFCAYIKLNDDNSALEFFISNISPSPEFSLSNFTKDIQPLLNELEYNKAQEMLRRHYIQQLSPNTQEFTNYITKIFSSKTQTTTASALNLYEKLCDLGISLNSITYGAFIMGFLSQDRYSEAEFIYNDMIKRGQRPTQAIYSGMLDGFSRRRGDRIHELWQQMLADKIQPDEIAYCAMIETYFRKRNIRDAIELFRQMSLDQNIKLNDLVYNRLIAGLLLNNRVDEAMIIYDQMKKQNIFPNIITYNTLINKLFDKKKAMVVLQDMQRFNITPDITTLTTLLKKQFQNRDMKGVQKILNMFDSMKIKPNEQTYGTLISGLLNNFNDLTGAEFAFNEMIYKRGLTPTIQIYTNMIQGYFNHGKFQLAEQLYSDLLQNNVPSTATFNILIGGYSKANNLDKAKQYYHEMIDLGIRPSHSTYKALINGYFISKNMSGASQIYDDMINVKFIPEDFELKRLCQTIEQWRSRQHNINKTLQIK